MKITPTSLTITQLLSSVNEQYVIPAYQRRYSWQDKQLWELIDDIRLIEGADTHLLGSIVCLTESHTAGINKLELVDGQQRLTTVSILLQCIHDRFKIKGEEEEAQDTARLLRAKAQDASPVRKMALDSIDSGEFDQLTQGTKLDRPANPNLSHAFNVFRKWVEGQKIQDLKKILYKLTNQAIVIRLDVTQAKDAFKLFETINNRGLRLSPVDIIKNFLLGNTARFNANALALARARWAELIKHLDGANFETFFRQFISARLKRRITVSYVISNFKMEFMQQVIEAAQLPDRHWYLKEEEPIEETDDVGEIRNIRKSEPIRDANRMSFAEFMDQLVSSAKIYGQIVRGRTGNTQCDRHLRNLRMIKSVQTYGFLMQLRVKGCCDAHFHKILQLTETLLLRRHVCRQRSNENETAFARLCGVDSKNPLPAVIETYREFCPSDKRFKEEFASTSGFVA